MQSQVGFWFLAKPWQRNGIYVEFIPYRFDGELTTTSSFRFGGVTYGVDQPVTSKALLNYVSLGYYRDIVVRRRVRAGLLAGLAYIGVRSEANSPEAGTAEVNRDVPFPLVGVSARFSPWSESQFSFRGDMRGMTFGSYGSYIDVAGCGWFQSVAACDS